MLNYGFFEDFKGSDTLLFNGTADELQSLIDVLHGVAAGTLVGDINLDLVNGFRPRRSTLVTIRVVSERRSEVTIERMGESVIAHWRLSPPDAAHAEELMMVVHSHPTPGHHYLEQGGDTQVIASKEEYPSDLWTQ